MSTVYVLLMVWSTNSSYGGVSTTAQEFTSRANCEAAREALAKAHDSPTAILRVQGCFPK